MGPLIALTIAGGLLRASAAHRAAQAQAAQDEYNARLTEAAAGDAKARGQVDEGNVRRLTSERISSDKAQLGASGVDVQSGSALDALAGQRARGELAAMVVRSNATRTAWGLEGQAQNFRSRGAYALQSGADAELSAIIGTATDVAANVAKAGGTPGVDAPLIRLGEPTTPPPLMPGRYPLEGWNPNPDGGVMMGP